MDVLKWELLSDPSPVLGSPLTPFLTWVLSLWLWILSAWVLTPLRTRSVGTGVLILPALPGCWAPGSDGAFCMLEPASSLRGLFKLSRLLECRAAPPSFLVGTAFPHCPVSPGSWLLFPCPHFPLLTCSPNTHWPQLSPLLLQRLVCPYFWSWLSLACPILLLIISQLQPMVLTFKVKIQFVSLCGLAKHVKAYAMTEGLCQGSNKEVCSFPEEDYL